MRWFAPYARLLPPVAENDASSDEIILGTLNAEWLRRLSIQENACMKRNRKGIPAEAITKLMAHWSNKSTEV